MGTPVPIIKVDDKLVAQTRGLLKDTGVTGLVARICGVGEEYVEQFRIDNIARWFAGFRTRCEERAIVNERLIPLSLFRPALRVIAEEDDATMLDLYARLVADFCDADRAGEPHRLFIGILSEMRPIDFHLLAHLFSARAQASVTERATRSKEDPTRGGLTAAEVSETLSLPEESIILAAQSLTRQGCMSPSSARAVHILARDAPLPVGPYLTDRKVEYVPNELAAALLDALGVARASVM